MLLKLPNKLKSTCISSKKQPNYCNVKPYIYQDAIDIIVYIVTIILLKIPNTA